MRKNKEISVIFCTLHIHFIVSYASCQRYNDSWNVYGITTMFRVYIGSTANSEHVFVVELVISVYNIICVGLYQYNTDYNYIIIHNAATFTQYHDTL